MNAHELAQRAAEELLKGGYQAAQTAALVAIALALTEKPTAPAFAVATCRRGCGRPVAARSRHCNTRECEQEWLNRR